MNNYPNILKEAFKDYLEINRFKKDRCYYLTIHHAYKVKDLILNYQINQYKNHCYFFNQSLL